MNKPAPERDHQATAYDSARGCAEDPRDAAWSCPFVINGRFLAQTVTGVQRYAREIVGALDKVLHQRNGSASALAPRSVADAVDWQAIGLDRKGVGSGHAWEQGILPFLSQAPLLNLCNTAPALSKGGVVCLHDANVFNAPESYGTAFRLFYKTLQPVIARRALRVATVSRSAAEQIAQHLNLDPRKISVLPNGHEHALRWDASQSDLFEKHPPERPYVLLLASRALHKNVERILGLAEALDALGLDIKIVGGGASIFAKTRSAAASNVVWLGTVSDDDLALLLSRALCLAFPSLTEGFGLPVIEAMACNCPVVSSNRASLPDICGTAALLADPTDDHQWLHHFRRLAASPHLADDLRGRGQLNVRRFSWTSSARGYLNLFGH